MKNTIQKNNHPSSTRRDLLLLVFTCFISPLVQSEVTLDGSVGPAGALTGPDYKVTENLGKRAGSNLFHSFGRFNLNASESATFSGSTGIRNVISRVTGGQTSTIDGTLRVSIPNANLYLLNPAGVIFGEHATLDVPGSFHVSTADYLKFQDGVRFNSGVATASQVLATAAPEAFGFLGENPAGITLSGTNDSVLEVQQGSDLSLIGGDITIKDRALIAPGGQINLASVASAGEVIVTESGLDTTSFDKMGSIRMSHNPLKSLISLHSNKVFIRGGELTMINSTIAPEPGDDSEINIGLTGNLSIVGVQNIQDITSTLPGGLYVSAIDERTAGKIILDVAGLKMSQGAKILAESLATGNGGNLNIKANTISLSGIKANTIPLINFQTEISSDVIGQGDGGDSIINVEGKFEVLNGARVSSNNFATGKSGDMVINAGSMLLSAEGNSDPTGVLTAALNTGSPSDLTIITKKSLNIRNGGIILATTRGAAKGGNVNISSESISLSGDNTGILGGSLSMTYGNAGDISIKATKNLDVNDGASITTLTAFNARGGDLLIDAGNIKISDRGGVSSVAGPNGTGDAGNITIKAGNFVMSDGLITSLTGRDSTGKAGNLTLEVTDKVEMSNGAIISASTSGTGQGGDLIVTANDILLDEARLEAASLGFKDIDVSRNPKAGKAGNIIITPRSTLRLKNGSSISVETIIANAGDITINNGKILHLSDSKINTSVHFEKGNGGDIFISTPNVALDNSSIIAQAREGQGGNINIKGFLFQSPSSLVTASSELGVDGELNLKPETNISGSIAVLPDTFMNASQQLSERCVARLGNNLSSFVVKGRGGLPLSPGDLAPSNYLDYWADDGTSLENKGGEAYKRSSGLEESYQFASINFDCSQ